MYAIINGNLGRDAEVKQIRGKDVLSLTVADSKRDGNGNETTTWVTVICYNMKLRDYLRKGKAILAIGELSINTYTGKQGDTRLDVTVWANTMKLLSGGGSRQQSNGQQPGYQQNPNSYGRQGGQNYQQPAGGQWFGNDPDDLPFE